VLKSIYLTKGRPELTPDPFVFRWRLLWDRVS